MKRKKILLIYIEPTSYIKDLIQTMIKMDNYELDIMHDPIINVLDHWEHREKRR